ncbi:MAG: hypothetical protein AB7H93_14215 [Vicinamibacterales bacterium]
MSAARVAWVAAITAAWLAVPVAAAAQGRRAGPRPATRQTPAPRDTLSLQGFGMAGLTFFTAKETFDAVLDTSTGSMVGGGVRLIIPGGPYLEVGAWRFRRDGERVFVGSGGDVFRLGIPATVTMTPLEVTAGWRFRGLLGRRVTPYLGAGFTSLRYEETSEFADSGENVSDRFSGYHLTGGAEMRLHRWVALTGDMMWTAVPDAIGGAGASQVFEEDDLGGTSLRLRLVIGR